MSTTRPAPPCCSTLSARSPATASNRTSSYGSRHHGPGSAQRVRVQPPSSLLMSHGRELPCLAALTLLSAPFCAAAQITLPTAPIGAPAATPAPIVAPSWFQSGKAAAPVLPAMAGLAGPQGLIPGPGEVLEVVPLRYADVSEVVGLLTGDQNLKPNDNFTPQEPNFGSTGGQTYYGAGGGAFPTSPVAPSFSPEGSATDPVGHDVNDSIGVDRRLNAVILKGAPERVAAIKAAIASLDQPVTSVVLETVFV